MKAHAKKASIERRIARVRAVLATADVELTSRQVQRAVRVYSIECTKYALARLIESGDVIMRKAFVAHRSIHTMTSVYRLADGPVAKGGSVVAYSQVIEEDDRQSRGGLGIQDHAEVLERIATVRAMKIARGEEPFLSWIVPRGRDWRFG